MSNQIVTGNVTGFLESVFHPEWSFSTTSGFILQINTSLDGNVTIGDTSTNYTLYLNGTQITGSGQGVASLNTLQGGLTISTTTVTDISIYTSGASTIYVDYIGTGGTTLSGLTGNISLSAGVGIDISVNTTTSEILFINRGVVGLSYEGSTLSGIVGLIAGENISLHVDSTNNTLTICAANGGGAGPIVNVCDWAFYRANHSVNLCGQSIYDSSGSVISLSGTVYVADALTVIGPIMSSCGDLTITSGNIVTASGSLAATSAAFGSNMTVGGALTTSQATITHNLNLGRSTTSIVNDYWRGCYDITGIRHNYGTSDIADGAGLAVITFARPFADASYIVTLGGITGGSSLSAQIANIDFNSSRYDGSCTAVIKYTDGNPAAGGKVFYTAIGAATTAF